MPFERKRMIKYIEKTPITQGWSDDYKYFALGADGKKYLLRVTPGKINPDFITLFVMIFDSTPKEHMLFMPGRTAARPNPLLQ